MTLDVVKSLKNKLKINKNNMNSINDFISNEQDTTTRCIYRMVKERLLSNPTISKNQILSNMIRDRQSQINTYNKLFRTDLVSILENEIEVISKLIGCI